MGEDERSALRRAVASAICNAANYPSSSDRSIHWTAAGAKRAGERRIERYERQRYDYLRRQAIARMETGYKEDS